MDHLQRCPGGSAAGEFLALTESPARHEFWDRDLDRLATTERSPRELGFQFLVKQVHADRLTP